jgi:hypothetical protein
MGVENRFIQDDIQPVTASPSDAYEIYWSSTENDTSRQSPDAPQPSFDSLRLCSPGDAYNQLWLIWDAR